MAVHQILLILCLGSGRLVAYGQPNFPPTGGQSECEQNLRIMACLMPMGAVVFSPEGQQLTQPGGPSQIPESLYNTLCSTAQPAATCAAGVLSRCAPPEKRADVQVFTRAATKIVSTCSEPNSYSKFKKLASCVDKIKTAAQACGQTAEAGVPESEKLFSSDKTDDFGAMVRNTPSQKQICCTVKKFKECVASSVQSNCSAEEKTVADNFGDRVLRDLECTDAVYRTCDRT